MQIWGQSASRWYSKIGEGQQGSGEDRAEEWGGWGGSSARPGTGGETSRAEEDVGATWEGNQASEGSWAKGMEVPQSRVLMGPTRRPAGRGPRGRAPGGCRLAARLADSMPVFARFLVECFIRRHGDGVFLQFPTSTKGLLLGGLLLRWPRGCPGDGLPPKRHHAVDRLERK